MAAKDHLVHTRGLVHTRAYSDELWKNFGPGDYGCKGPLSTYARLSKYARVLLTNSGKISVRVTMAAKDHLVHKTRVVHRWGFR